MWDQLLVAVVVVVVVVVKAVPATDRLRVDVYQSTRSSSTVD